jgi:hypothetical protein
MPNPGLRLNSSEISPPHFSLGDHNWTVLEGVLGIAIPPDARDSAMAVCTEYLLWRSAELNAGSVSDLKALLAKLKKVAMSLATLEQYFQGSDTALALKGLMRNALSATASKVDPEQLRRLGKDGWGLLPISEEAPLAVVHDPKSIVAVGRSLSVAIENAEHSLRKRESEGKYKSFVDGSAIGNWCIDLKGWAKDSDLPHGTYNTQTGDSEPSPFSKFAYELHRMMPNDHQEPQVNSAAAMAARIKRAVAADKKNQKIGSK